MSYQIYTRAKTLCMKYTKNGHIPQRAKTLAKVSGLTKERSGHCTETQFAVYQ